MVKEVLRPHIDRRLPARQVARSHKLAVAQDKVSGITNGSGSASASCGCTCISQEP